MISNEQTGETAFIVVFVFKKHGVLVFTVPSVILEELETGYKDLCRAGCWGLAYHEQGPAFDPQHHVHEMWKLAPLIPELRSLRKRRRFIFITRRLLHGTVNMVGSGGCDDQVVRKERDT